MVRLAACGYREWQPYLDGQADLAATVALIQKHSHQFAKRQYTWLRGELDARWFDPLSQRDALDAAVAGFLGA